MHIIGTAGHVDHGKSALVQALTGTNPDRWLEEQLRGMTLDLGFAQLKFNGDVEAGIVDVPGHERFLHNMLAGAAGMELLLLVVAANEGAMPQTYEHLAVLKYLNVRRTIVVVTKIDLVEVDAVKPTLDAIRQSLDGMVSSDAPIVAVSTVTGVGLDELRMQIGTELRSMQPRDDQAPPYLPIDRVFALPGHGTIVTGTLMQGTLEVGSQLMLQPSGKKARIRSLQVFGRPQDHVTAGARVAANLPNVAVSEIARGEVLASAQFEPAATFDVQFTAHAGAVDMLRRRMPVKAYIGSAEIAGSLIFAEPANDARAVRATLHLQRPTIVYPGTHFVVRRISPKTLLGGGTIHDVTAAEAEGPSDAAFEIDRRTLGALEALGLQPIEAEKLAARVNVREEVLRSALERLIEGDRVMRVARPEAFAASTHAQRFLHDVMTTMQAHVRLEPWSLGMTALALSRSLAVDESLVLRLLTAFAHDGKLAHRAGYYAPAEHVPQLSTEQRAFFESAVPVDSTDPFRPVACADVLEKIREDRIPGLSRAFDTLVVSGALVKVGDDLYRGSQIKQINRKLEQLVAHHRQITMAQFRDLIGTSRKHAVPLLEWFDARGITVRSGDYRMLRTTTVLK
ncbi:MAG: selenocysteine-specific translation elongation factor [Candidatus Eremiobacteraeota bacterium]|nr:selenocysteine-specific translation elongation factor [Candidatus Eremiobacteraeota bacterium]